MALVLAAGGMMAQSALDLGSRMQLRRDMRSEATISSDSLTVKRMKASRQGEGNSAAFVTIADGYDRADLERGGFNVKYVRDSLAIVSFPTSLIDSLSNLPCVKSIRLSRPLKLHLKNAKESTGVGLIHSGVNLSRAYTGKGVVAGIIDQGIDPNHINFKDGEGNSRFGLLMHTAVDPLDPSRYTTTDYTADNIASFRTDNDKTYHGSHTAGIMAGSFSGTLSAAVPVDGKNSTISEMANPYGGVAPEATIVMGCGDVEDVIMMEELERIVAYSKEHNMPAVINLSLGSNTGAHDPRAAICSYLDGIAEDAIVCVSAGNEGELPIVITKEMAAMDNEIKTFLFSTYGPEYANARVGQTWVYSRDESSFDIKGVIFDLNQGKIVAELPIPENAQPGFPIYYAVTKQDESDIVDATFCKAFDENSYLGVGWSIDSDTGRYYAVLDYSTQDNQQTNADGNLILGFIVTGKEGQRIECYCDGMAAVFDNFSVSGWQSGVMDGTINDMACGYKTIAVGAYNTLGEWGAMDGNVYGFMGDNAAGHISSFSSWGTLSDGRQLPDVCAPGATLISSSNRYFCARYNMPDSEIQAVYTDGSGMKYQWMQMMGTSMSSPFVAGAIALWLEADPSLTSERVKEIIAATSTKDNDVLEGNPVQWGAGKFNAYEGLKEVIRSSGIKEIGADGNCLMITPLGNNSYEVFAGHSANIDINVFDIAGNKVFSARNSSDEAVVNLSDLQKGIYIMSVNGIHSQKISVR